MKVDSWIQRYIEEVEQSMPPLQEFCKNYVVILEYRMGTLSLISRRMVEEQI